MKIDKIVKMKNGKYKIYLDGEIVITYDNVILDNNLLFNKDITQQQYKKIIESTDYYDIYNKTVKYILKRRRSKKDIEGYLSKSSLSDNNKIRILNKLEDLRLINDTEYCRAYINDKLYLSKYGIKRIKNDLLEENIPLEIVNNELDNIDISIINNRLEKLIKKKIDNNKKYSNVYLKQKIIKEMSMLGYSKDSIIEILNNYIISDENILIEQFNKTYNSLSRKYTKDVLKNKVKQKLLSMGFNLIDINKLIQEKTEK